MTVVHKEIVGSTYVCFISSDGGTIGSSSDGTSTNNRIDIK